MAGYAEGQASAAVELDALLARATPRPGTGEAVKEARWFESQRTVFIAEMLHVYGFINREHLMRKFGISQLQASKDLQSYQRNSAGSMSYNLSAKRYEATNGHR